MAAIATAKSTSSSAFQRFIFLSLRLKPETFPSAL